MNLACVLAGVLGLVGIAIGVMGRAEDGLLPAAAILIGSSMITWAIHNKSIV